MLQMKILLKTLWPIGHGISSAMALPFSNAFIERAFSVMNNVKNKMRNKMCLKSLNAVLHIKYGLIMTNQCCKEIEYSTEVLKKIESTEKYIKSKYILNNPNLIDTLDDSEEFVNVDQEFFEI